MQLMDRLLKLSCLIRGKCVAEGRLRAWSTSLEIDTWAIGFPLFCMYFFLMICVESSCASEALLPPLFLFYFLFLTVSSFFLLRPDLDGEDQAGRGRFALKAVTFRQTQLPTVVNLPVSYQSLPIRHAFKHITIIICRIIKSYQSNSKYG